MTGDPSSIIGRKAARITSCIRTMRPQTPLIKSRMDSKLYSRPKMRF